jgi:hypothetical protein
VALAIVRSLAGNAKIAKERISICTRRLNELAVLDAMTVPVLLALSHAAASCGMAGVLWVVQLVLYPAFAIVPIENLPAYAAAHARRITPIVGPLMLVEAATFVALVMLRVPMPGWIVVVGAATLIANWVSTFLWQVPLHGRIQRGDVGAIALLVRSNWLRTICWTTRGLIGMMMVSIVLSQTAVVSG